jgi:antitoxin component HigA of HigAB toxin-antitoxin module
MEMGTRSKIAAKRGLPQAVRQSRGIRTKADYRNALKEVETLMNAQAGTPEGERLGVLATLVEAYERRRLGERKRD